MKIDADSIGFVLGLQTLVGITTAYWAIGQGQAIRHSQIKLLQFAIV